MFGKKKSKLKVDSPIFVAESILYLSRIITYEFYYDYMTPKWSKNTLCVDTDSLIPLIKTDDLYKDIASDIEK